MPKHIIQKDVMIRKLNSPSAINRDLGYWLSKSSEEWVVAVDFHEGSIFNTKNAKITKITMYLFDI